MTSAWETLTQPSNVKDAKPIIYAWQPVGSRMPAWSIKPVYVMDVDDQTIVLKLAFYNADGKEAVLGTHVSDIVIGIARASAHEKPCILQVPVTVDVSRWPKPHRTVARSRYPIYDRKLGHTSRVDPGHAVARLEVEVHAHNGEWFVQNLFLFVRRAASFTEEKGIEICKNCTETEQQLQLHALALDVNGSNDVVATAAGFKHVEMPDNLAYFFQLKGEGAAAPFKPR